MPTLGDLLTAADRRFNASQGYGTLADMARGAAAATVPSYLGAPVDLATMLLNVPLSAMGRKIENPVGGSQQIARMMGLAGPQKADGAPMNSYDKGYLLSSLLQMAAPMVAPAVASRGRVAPTNQRGSVGVAGAKTQYELAHEIAQRNAALPVEKGGLGLPPNNTAADRARAMGFDTPAVHFSRTGVDADVLDSGQYAIAPFDAIGTHFGSKKAAAERFARTIGTTERTQGVSYPVILKGRRQMLNDANDYFSEEPLAMMLSSRSDYGNLRASNKKLRDEIFSSFDMIPYVNDVEAKGSVSYIAPPQSIRSMFAAFDPAKRDSSDLLASVAPYGLSSALLALLAAPQDAQAK